MTSAPVIAVDLGKTRCRVVVADESGRLRIDGDGAPGLASARGASESYDAIDALLGQAGASARRVGVGAAGAWAAPEAASELARRLAARTGAAVVVASDVVTAHLGALGGADGALLIAGTGAAALGVDADGVRLVDGWGPELGDLGGGSWLGREALRAVLRADAGLGAQTSLTAELADAVGPASGIPSWAGAREPLARRLAALAPIVLAAAEQGDSVALGIVQDAVRLLTSSAVAATRSSVVAVHGGLTDHAWFRATLAAALQDAGRTVVTAAGDALDGALLLAGRTDLPHERFAHRAE